MSAMASLVSARCVFEGISQRASQGLDKVAGAVRRASVEIQRASIELTMSPMDRSAGRPSSRTELSAAEKAEWTKPQGKKRDRRLTAFDSFVIKSSKTRMEEEIDEQGVASRHYSWLLQSVAAA